MKLHAIQNWNQSIRAVLLDAVGTTIVPAKEISQTYLEFGRQYETHLDENEIKQSFWQAFRDEDEKDRLAGYVTSEERERQRWQTIVRSVFSDIPETKALFSDLWQYYSQPQAWRPIPETLELIEELKNNGNKVVLASNFDARLRQIVAGWPVLAGIGHLAISSELGWRKPAREFYQKTLQLISLPANQVLSIGDDLVNDVQGALAAGLQAELIQHKTKEVKPQP